MLKRYLFLAFIFSLSCGLNPSFLRDSEAGEKDCRCKEPVVIYSLQADYDDVWKGLEMALNERGLTISSVSHVGEMLERTGKELGRTKRIFGKANVMEFCSAVISRDMMEKNPHYIAFCPYQIMVYTLPDNEKKIYLSYRKLIWKDESGRAVLAPVEELLDSIIRDVIDMYK